MVPPGAVPQSTVAPGTVPPGAVPPGAVPPGAVPPGASLPTASPSATARDSHARRQRRPSGRRALFTSLGAALALAGVGVAATAWNGWTRTGGGTPESPQPAASRSAAPVLPAGWRPWQMSLRQESLRAATADLDSGCLARGPALYCGGESFAVSRLDAATGKVTWRFPSKEDSSAPLLVGNERVIVNDFEGPDWSTDKRQWVTGLDTKDGSVRWTHSVATGSKPVATGNLVVTESVDERNLIAMNTSDGDEAWRWALPTGHYCNPWVENGVLYAFCYGNTAASYEGTLWRLDTADGTAGELGPVAPYVRPVGVDGNALILAEYAVAADGTKGRYTKLRRMNTDTGKTGTVPLPDGTSAAHEDTLRVAGGTLYVARANGTVTAVSARTGTARWRRETGVEHLSAPVLSKKYGALYFVNQYGRLLALGTDNGRRVWQAPARDGVEARSARTTASSSQVLLVDDAIVGLVDGQTFSVSPSAPRARPSTAATAS
jgi:outer membrane protein assembly factor BamB